MIKEMTGNEIHRRTFLHIVIEMVMVVISPVKCSNLSVINNNDAI